MFMFLSYLAPFFLMWHFGCDLIECDVSTTSKRLCLDGTALED